MKFSVSILLCCFVFLQLSFGQKLDYPDFRIEKLADGVYAAIAKNGGHAICNAGIIDLGDATLIFDSFMSVQAAEDLKKAAQELTHHPVKYVVNSHYHNDHIGGNQVFEGASIISTYRTRDLMAEYQPEKIEFGKTQAPAILETYQQKDVSALTDLELAEHRNWIAYFEAYVQSADVLKLALPNLTMDDELNLYGSKRHVQLLSYGVGHSESDLFLYLPDEQIAFLGDLLVVRYQPWVQDGDTDLWIAYLNKVNDLGVKTLVPGHGPVGAAADIELLEAYFHNIEETARMYHSKGISPEEVEKIESPPPYDSWFFSSLFGPNVISAYKRLFEK